MNMIRTEGFLMEGTTYMEHGQLVQARNPMNIMVESESDLTALAGKVDPGSIAYTAGYGSAWQLDASGAWQTIG